MIHPKHWPRWRLAAYLTVTLIGVLALSWYQRNVNDRFDRADRVSCAQRKVLIANQQRVLRYLHTHADQADVDGETGRPWFIEFAIGLRSVPTPTCKS